MGCLPKTISWRPVLVLAGGYALAGLAGYLALLAHIPLAWMLAPMMVAAALSIAGVRLTPDDRLRRLGQLSVGGTVGLYLTAPVIGQLAVWLPLMVASAFAAILISCFFSALLARFGNIDEVTAFYASLPGGLAEMANIGARDGAHPEPIALVQTLRISLVVLIVPPILVSLGTPDPLALNSDMVSIPSAFIVIAGGLVVALAIQRLGVNNPFMLGSVLFGGGMAASGLMNGHFHPALLAAAQVLIGFGVGCRFKRTMLLAMPRVALVGLGCILGSIVATSLLGVAIWQVTGIDLADALLGTSPGGFAEMAATAQVLHLAVPLVAGFQIVRSVVINGFSTHFFALAKRSGLLGAIHRLFRS